MKLTESQLKQIIAEEVNEVLSRREAQVLAWVTPAVQGLLAILDSRLKAGRISPAERQQSLDDAMEDATEANLERGKYDSIDDYILSHCAGFEKYKIRPDWFGPLKDYLDDEEVKLGPEAQACLLRYVEPVSEARLKQFVSEEIEKILIEDKRD